MDYSPSTLTPQERDEKRVRVRAQFKQAKGDNPLVDCGCGHAQIPLRFMYRCYYCGEFYCSACAADHFGRK